MTEKTTEVPSLIGSLMNAFVDSPEAKQFADMFASIGGALASAGVVHAGAHSAEQLGQLALDANLPKMASAGREQDTMSLGGTA